MLNGIMWTWLVISALTIIIQLLLMAGDQFPMKRPDKTDADAVLEIFGHCLRLGLCVWYLLLR